MDRFEYIEARLFEGENYLKRDKNVKIYDGDDKVVYFDVLEAYPYSNLCNTKSYRIHFIYNIIVVYCYFNILNFQLIST